MHDPIAARIPAPTRNGETMTDTYRNPRFSGSEIPDLHRYRIDPVNSVDGRCDHRITAPGETDPFAVIVYLNPDEWRPIYRDLTLGTFDRLDDATYLIVRLHERERDAYSKGVRVAEVEAAERLSREGISLLMGGEL